MNSSANPSDGLLDEFSDVYQEYKDAIFRHCYFRTLNREQAKDILQDTFIKTWQYLASGHKIDNMRAFLYKVATNLIINDSRHKKSVSLEALQEAGFDPGENDAGLERDYVEEERVMKLLRKIDEPYRSVVTLRYVEGLQPAEIAEIQGESANTISVRIHRGLQQIRDHFDNA